MILLKIDFSPEKLLDLKFYREKFILFLQDQKTTFLGKITFLQKSRA